MTNPRLVKVRLCGHLGKRFGRTHRFVLSTPGEAFRAFKANFKDFERYMIEHSAPGYRVITDMGELKHSQLAGPIGSKGVTIVPVITGAGNGTGQFILGAALVAADWASDYAFGGGNLTNIGVAMMVGGVAQMLFHPQQKQPGNGGTQGYSFNGPVNTTNQGNPVPICYGRLIVGSQVISGGMYAANIPI